MTNTNRAHELRSGSYVVKITGEAGRFTSRLYVNHGETATLVVRKATTMAGALKQAVKMLPGKA